MSYLVRFLVLNFWKQSLSNFEILFRFFNSVAYDLLYSEMTAILCFIETGHTCHAACTVTSLIPFLVGPGFRPQTLTLSHYFRNEKGIFWNIYNVTALILLLCLYGGNSCFACLFPISCESVWPRAIKIFLLRPNIIIRCLINFWQ